MHSSMSDSLSNTSMYGSFWEVFILKEISRIIYQSISDDREEFGEGVSGKVKFVCGKQKTATNHLTDYAPEIEMKK